MKQLVGYKLVMEQILIILLYKQQIINFIDHQLNGATNSTGWIFMHYRNDGIIIYILLTQVIFCNIERVLYLISSFSISFSI